MISFQEVIYGPFSKDFGLITNVDPIFETVA